MKTRLTAIVTAVLLVGGIGLAYAQDQSAPAEAKPMMKTRDMMNQMMSRCHMTANAPLSSHDPAVLLGMKDQLKLTDQQVKQLQAVAQKARQTAMAVLTNAQRNQIKQLPQQPQSMMQMRQRTMDQMMKMKDKKGMSGMQGMKGMGGMGSGMGNMQSMKGMKGMGGGNGNMQGMSGMDMCSMMMRMMMNRMGMHSGMGMHSSMGGMMSPKHETKPK